MNSRGFNVYAALEGSLGLDAIREALPVGTPVHSVSLAEAGRAGSEIQDGVDLVIVGCSESHDQALEVIAAATKQRVDRPVVVLYHGTPNGFLEQAFDAGADDLVALPLSAGQLGFALEKVLARRRGVGALAAEGAMITVLGPKGGTGKTVTSSNLVVALALEGKSAVLIDLDLQFGDVGLALGLAPTKTIYDLAVSGGSLDSDKIDGFLAEHPSGARAMLAPLRPDQAAAVGTPFLREVFELLRARYDFVVVDTPPAFSPEVIAAVDASSHLCVVGMLDALSLKDTKIGLETLEQMGYDPRAVTLVLNRADSDVGITQADVEQLLGRAPDVLVGSDRAIPRALTNGQPIVVADPRSKAARSYAQLADRYLAATERQAEATPALAATASNGNVRRRLSLRKAG
jgi:pilus assembly protein CpaE